MLVTIPSRATHHWLCIVIAVIALGGCANTRMNVPTRHVVMFNEYGRLLDPTGTVGCQAPPALCNGRHLSIIPYPELSKDQRDAYLQDVLAGLKDAPRSPSQQGEEDGRQAEKSARRRLLVFVHGGLNTQKQSVERVVELTGRISDAGYHPLFVNWRSSLISSYFEHAFFIRQGEQSTTFSPLTAPFVIAADIGRSVARAPLVWGAQLQGGVQSWPWMKLPHGLDAREAQLKGKKADPSAIEGSPAMAIDLATGRDERSWADKALAGISWALLEPVRLLIAAPLTDGFGTPAWDNMLRRTQLLFHTADEYEGARDDRAKTGGDLAFLVRRLQQALQEEPDDWEVVLVGHSMGAIVLNELLREFPNFTADTIVYMAAACSVRDFKQSVIPYLQRHPKTQFYNLSLHHKAEERERWDLRVPYVDPAMRGSLLTWIDDFFSNPLTPMDKTLGQYVNFLRTEQIYSPPSLRSRIHQKVFSVGGDFSDTEPQQHGDFSRFQFWNAGFYRPDGKAGSGQE
jgi:pimeloyl-ACP methyl ester carboxylesterase